MRQRLAGVATVELLERLHAAVRALREETRGERRTACAVCICEEDHELREESETCWQASSR